MDDLDQEKTTLLANHINSTKRDSLNGHSPFELSQLLLDNQLLSTMGYKLIAPDDVMLTPELLKENRSAQAGISRFEIAKVISGMRNLVSHSKSECPFGMSKAPKISV